MIVHNLLFIQLTMLQLSLLYLTIQANVVDVNKQGMQANKRPQQKLPNEPILFKFEISDAVEPSDEVKALLQQQRQKITPKLTTTTTTTTTTSTTTRAPAVKRSRNGSGRKSKRNKRATSAAQAFDHKSIKFIPFVVSEAREPDEITKAMIKRMRQLELNQHNVAKSASEKKRNQRQIKRIRRAATLTKPEMISFELADAKLALRETRHLKQNASSEDQSTQEAKRYYVYKEAPIKLRKSTHVVPTEVQEVLDLLSNYKTPKPYVKYVPMQQLELSAMKNAFYYNKFGSTTKLQPVAYIKSVRPYVKKPTALSLKGYITESPAVLDNPIVVSPASENVESSQKNNYEFRPSKPDTYLTEQKQHNEIYDYGKYYKTYTSQPKQQVAQEQVYKVATSTETPLIKIEYHVPANVLKGDYKDFDDFKQLSTLIGKSPQDQMHGLTYLLAKEMQHKLHSQRQPTKSENVFALRPQDSTAPVLFEPEEKPAEDDMDNSDIEAAVTEKIMGMAKTKTYVPIVENVGSVKSEKPMPTSTSFIHYDLYSNKFKYNTDNSQNQLVVQHPAVAPDTVITPAKPHMKSETSEYNINHDKLQYASKYTFGYRIRDFYTGNDFGHKQNRDLHGVTRGQYHILLPDGRIQNVIYHADDSGFHADVSFEGGTK